MPGPGLTHCCCFVVFFFNSFNSQNLLSYVRYHSHNLRFTDEETEALRQRVMPVGFELRWLRPRPQTLEQAHPYRLLVISAPNFGEAIRISAKYQSVKD